MEKSSLNKKLPVLPPCKVCGEQASGYHYGVNSCGACKGFFLRSLSRIEPYSCVTGGQCKVGPEIKRRKSCQKCRFDKCIRLGMSKNAIKIGRYTYSKRTQDTLELQQLQNPTSSTVQREDFQDSTSQTNHIADDTSILLKNVSPLDVSEVQTSASSNLQCEKNMSNFPTLVEENIFFNPKFPLFKSNLEIKSSCLKEIRHPGNELKETIFDQELDDQERESEMSPAQGGMQLSEARKHTTATNCTQTVSRNVTCSKYLNDAPNCMLNKEIFINENF
ncbi:nuclear receptor subfamily 1 group D member 2-like [Physella acuta]|uniref:nuclear receptor subfamily 1 group D member 2-like n=1 Tax=Physella acuta TaxID=109671 RepID=UPI0027DE19C1|nr:nuclear receptor subfamily 1 group D member 2-like [Physella acuta]XP_059144341.1 nuclear receptor subfamily 1 group D member 2-like [Physella acuta]